VSAAPVARPAWVEGLASALRKHDEPWVDVLRPAKGARQSAVLALFGEGPAGPEVLLVERAATLRSHPGQIAFPGGAVDPTDVDLADTALREAYEECGVVRDGVEVLGELPSLFLPPSGFVVTPVLAWWREPSPVSAVDPTEVARVQRVPLADVLDPANRVTARHPSGYLGPAFTVDGLFVWGFTAGLLSRVLELAGLDQPWQRDRVVDLPPDVVALLQ